MIEYVTGETMEIYSCSVHRVPAEHLEKVLLAQVGRLFRTPGGGTDLQ